eukprot:TRINITY_DN988_c0_g1_i3.p1 TRINITY_DN988_c0_g1~~TRINITY_DN988_c0_g1_i3.p1  ORF type:complete len:418 (+),score=108.74 TRINITY_DN988_c0_g1_i3:94-1347(+)
MDLPLDDWSSLHGSDGWSEVDLNDCNSSSSDSDTPSSPRFPTPETLDLEFVESPSQTSHDETFRSEFKLQAIVRERDELLKRTRELEEELRQATSTALIASEALADANLARAEEEEQAMHERGMLQAMVRRVTRAAHEVSAQCSDELEARKQVEKQITARYSTEMIGHILEADAKLCEIQTCQSRADDLEISNMQSTLLMGALQLQIRAWRRGEQTPENTLDNIEILLPVDPCIDQDLGRISSLQPSKESPKHPSKESQKQAQAEDESDEIRELKAWVAEKAPQWTEIDGFPPVDASQGHTLVYKICTESSQPKDAENQCYTLYLDYCRGIQGEYTGKQASRATKALQTVFRYLDQHFTSTMNYKHMKHTKPVSYTHLRAHETVLDLVCRLLLEKKKKNNNTKNYQTLCNHYNITKK